MKKNNILTGLIPTENGCHLGHYIGNIKPIIEIQNDVNSFFLIGDLHLISKKGDSFAFHTNGNDMKSNILLMIAQLLAIGVSPQKTHFYTQSQIAEYYGTLIMLLSNHVSFNRIKRLPALKKEDNYNTKFSHYQFPLYQTIDIMSICANQVVSNYDNKPIIEFSNELIKKVNRAYGFSFPKVEFKTGITKQLVGLDGRKMCKSYNNYISFMDDPFEIQSKIKKMTSTYSPYGNGELTSIPLLYYSIFNTNKTEVMEIQSQYSSKKISDLDVKHLLSNKIIDFIKPIKVETLELLNKKDFLLDILNDGVNKVKDHIIRVKSINYKYI
ncbi:MAG: hypothetical protein AB7S50_03620 [Bacteroidales bacterium]